MESYIQYVNSNGNVKCLELVDPIFEENYAIFELPTIDEQFFLVALFYKNFRVFGVNFVDLDNIPMLAFLNSELTSIDALPQESFFPALQKVSIRFDYDRYIGTKGTDYTSIIQEFKDQNVLYYQQIIDILNAQNSSNVVSPMHSYGIVRPTFFVKSRSEFTNENTKGMRILRINNYANYYPNKIESAIFTDGYGGPFLYQFFDSYAQQLYNDNHHSIFQIDDIFVRIELPSLSDWSSLISFDIIVDVKNNCVYFVYDVNKRSCIAYPNNTNSSSWMFRLVDNRDMDLSDIFVSIDWKSIPMPTLSV